MGRLNGAQIVIHCGFLRQTDNSVFWRNFVEALKNYDPEKAEERVIEAAAKAGYSSVTEYNESPIRHYYCYGCGERRAESAVEKCRLCKREEKLSEQEAEKQGT